MRALKSKLADFMLKSDEAAPQLHSWLHTGKPLVITFTGPDGKRMAVRPKAVPGPSA